MPNPDRERKRETPPDCLELVRRLSQSSDRPTRFRQMIALEIAITEQREGVDAAIQILSSKLGEEQDVPPYPNHFDSYTILSNIINSENCTPELRSMVNSCLNSLPQENDEEHPYRTMYLSEFLPLLKKHFELSEQQIFESLSSEDPQKRAGAAAALDKKRNDWSRRTNMEPYLPRAKIELLLQTCLPDIFSILKNTTCHRDLPAPLFFHADALTLVTTIDSLPRSFTVRLILDCFPFCSIAAYARSTQLHSEGIRQDFLSLPKRTSLKVVEDQRYTPEAEGALMLLDYLAEHDTKRGNSETIDALVKNLAQETHGSQHTYTSHTNELAYEALIHFGLKTAAPIMKYLCTKELIASERDRLALDLSNLGHRAILESLGWNAIPIMIREIENTSNNAALASLYASLIIHMIRSGDSAHLTQLDINAINQSIGSLSDKFSHLARGLLAIMATKQAN